MILFLHYWAEKVVRKCYCNPARRNQLGSLACLILYCIVFIGVLAMFGISIRNYFLGIATNKTWLMFTISLLWIVVSVMWAVYGLGATCWEACSRMDTEQQEANEYELLQQRQYRPSHTDNSGAAHLTTVPPEGNGNIV